MLSTEKVVVGHVCKCRKLMFDLATRSPDEHSELIYKSEGRCHGLQLLATVDGNRILGRAENRNHKVSLTSQAREDSFAFGCPSLGPLVRLGGVAST